MFDTKLATVEISDEISGERLGIYRALVKAAPFGGYTIECPIKGLIIHEMKAADALRALGPAIKELFNFSGQKVKVDVHLVS